MKKYSFATNHFNCSCKIEEDENGEFVRLEDLKKPKKRFRITFVLRVIFDILMLYLVCTYHAAIINLNDIACYHQSMIVRILEFIRI